MLEDVRDLSVLNEGLRRDATHIEADTAPILLLDDCNLLTQLSRTDCGDVATRARAEYYNVKMFISHAH